MRGPGVALVFKKGRGLAHSLRIEVNLNARAPKPLPWIVKSAAVADSEDLSASRITNFVYQELVPHELPLDQGAGLCALLTGSCFDHHFSAVFSLYRDHDQPDSIVFEVDAADRCRGLVETLSTTYLVSCLAGTIDAKRTTGNSLAWRADDPGGGVLELIAAPPAKLGEPPSPGAGRSIAIHAQIDPHTHTQRLHYRWRWASCSDLTR
jgi:hypothetical protein